MEETSRRTVGHYEERAEAFWEGTRDHDVSQNIDALLSCLPGDGMGKRVLDLGCGPGRDLEALTKRGVLATGLDGCESFCVMARSHSGCKILHQDFLALDLPAEGFDGIFANASLFHVPTVHLKGVLDALFSALGPGGVLFSSNPRGHYDSGANAGANYCCGTNSGANYNAHPNSGTNHRSGVSCGSNYHSGS